jgi:osmotically-inducible protein OsmY
MKTHKTLRLALLLALAALPAGLFAASNTDDKIENAAESSYNFRTVLDNAVDVKSDHGVVTLTGTVRDEDSKKLAEDTVENLPGVTRVDNQIAIDAQYPKYSDDWIAWKIRGTLLVKGNVSATATDVAVKDGVVTLTGTAENAAQKDLTEAYAKDIDHVKSVNNQIVVKPSADSDRAAGDRTRQSADSVVDDASITTQVKYALVNHRSTHALKTHVNTDHGVVVITGEAQNKEEKALVSKLAGQVRGVKSVNNEMTVRMD